MPIYEYQCDGCSNWTELMCDIESMPKSTECSTCGKDALRRIKSVPSVSISPKHQACGSNIQYHNLDPITGKRLPYRKKRK